MMDAKMNWGTHVQRFILPTLIFLVLFILAAVRFAQLAEKTREGTTVGRLHELRQAILLYYQDHNGIFPRELTTQGPFQRYLSEIPAVEPLKPKNTAPSPAGRTIVYGNGMPDGFGQGWYYNYESGQIFVNSIGRDSRGNSYTVY
jgi:hypothetical protein